MSHPQLPSNGWQSQDATMAFPDLPGGGKKSHGSRWLVASVVFLALALLGAAVVFIQYGGKTPFRTSTTASENPAPPAETPQPPPPQQDIPASPTASPPQTDNPSPEAPITTSPTTTPSASTTSPTTTPSASTPSASTDAPLKGNFPLERDYQPQTIAWSYPQLPSGWSQLSSETGIRVVGSPTAVGSFMHFPNQQAFNGDARNTEEGFTYILSQHMRMPDATLIDSTTMDIPVNGQGATIVFQVNDYTVQANDEQLTVRIASRAMGRHLAAVTMHSKVALFTDNDWRGLTEGLPLKFVTS